MDLMLYKTLGLLLVFGGVFLSAYALAPAGKGGRSLSRFDDQTALGEKTRLVRIFSPAFPLLRPIASRLPLENYSRRLKKLIITAGLDRELNVVDFLCFQLASLLLFVLLAFMLWQDWLACILASAVGAAYPYLWLWEKKSTRQREVALSMPNVVDMLSLSVEAGLDFLAAVKRIGELGAQASPSAGDLADAGAKQEVDPFVEELQYMYHNIKLGMSTDEALQNMAERVDIQEMYSFVSILVQAQKMGSSIADVLRSQALRMRQQRFMKAERMGAAASQKLLIPMMLCIFPILFIIIFAPYLLKYIYGR